MMGVPITLDVTIDGHSWIREVDWGAPVVMLEQMAETAERLFDAAEIPAEFVVRVTTPNEED